MQVFQAPQAQIIAALQAVSGVVERRQTMPILSNVLLHKQHDDVHLIASDLEIQVRTNENLGGDSGDFQITVGARKLIDIVNSMPAEQVITLTVDNDKATVKGGKSKFTLKTLPAADFPLVQEAADFDAPFSLPQKTLKSLMAQVSFAMAANDIRYYLNGILFVAEGNTLSLVATDGHRLAFTQATLDNEVPKQNVILPRKTVLELQRLLSDNDESMELQFAGNQARFRFGKMEFISKLVEGKFPNYDQVIPKNNPHHALIDRAALLASLKRTAILSNEKLKGVHMHFEADKLRVDCNNSDHEEAFDEIDVQYSGDTIDIGFNVTYLIDVLNHLNQDTVTISLLDGSNSALITVPDNDNFKYVVMPMRI